MKNVVQFSDGLAICGDVLEPDVMSELSLFLKEPASLIVADPPYFKILSDKWDKTDLTEKEACAWMVSWSHLYAEYFLSPRGAFYVWGGTGKPGFRPFIRYLLDAEVVGKFELANLITWKKRRGYGVQNNYLYTREECAYFCNGDAKKPLKFHVPLLDEVRGYAGYNKKYPAKSDKYRRTNVWTDITEVMRGKVHTAQKAQRVIEIPIEVHTDPGDTVIDMFAGSGTAALAARKLGRKFVLIEKDEATFDSTVARLQTK